MPKPTPNKLIPNPNTGGYTLYIPDSSFNENDFIDAYSHEKPKAVEAELFTANGPSYKDVGQVEEKACFFLSTIASIAMQNPDYIKQLITDNPENDTVTVHFYGIDPATHKKVPYDVIVDRSRTVLDNTAASWVNLMEKAYAASMLHKNLGELPKKDDLPYVDENTGKVVNEIYITESEMLRTDQHYVAIDGGSQPGVLQVLYKGTDDKPNIDSTDKTTTLSDVKNLDEATEILSGKLIDAFKNKGFLFFASNGHAVPIVNVKGEGKNTEIVLYDQVERKEYTITVKEALENQLNGKYPNDDFIDSISIMRVIDGKPVEVAEDYWIGDLKGKIQKAHKPVELKDAVSIYKKKIASILDVGNMHIKSEKIDLDQSLCVDKIIEEQMQNFIASELKSNPKLTPAKLRAELNESNSPIFLRFRENFLDTVDREP